jgi:hypothetical protein
MPDPTIYYQGTQANFDTWHATAKTEAGIFGDGIVTKVLGKDRPDLPKTTDVSETIPHETNQDDFIWRFGDYPNAGLGLTEYTQAEAISNGYIDDLGE